MCRCSILNNEADQIIRSLFRHIGLALVTLEAVEDGKNFRILDLNHEVEKIEKISKEDLTGQLITDVFPSVVDFGLFDAMTKAYKTGEVVHLPTRLYTDERQSGYRENNVMKLPSGHLLVVYTDKTSEIELKKSLIESEQNYRSLLDNSLVATTVSIDFKIVYANQEAASIWGYEKPSDIIGMNIVDTVHPDDRDKIIKRTELRLDEKDAPSRYRIKIQTPKEEQKYIDVRASIIEWDRERAVLGKFFDITENVEYQAKLEAIKHHTRNLAMSLSLNEIAEVCLDAISQVIGADYFTFQVVENDTLNSIISYPDRGALKLGLDGKGVTTKAAKTKKSILVNKIDENEDYYEFFEDIKSELAVPIVVNDETVAVINVESTRANNYSAQDQTLMEIFSEDVALAISRLRYMEDMQLAEKRFKYVLDSSPDPILVVDEEYFLYANERASTFLHFENTDDIIGKKINDLIPHSNDLKISETLTKKLGSKYTTDIVQMQTRTTSDNKIRYFEGNLRTIEYEKKKAVMMTLRDITSLKLHQRRLENLHRHTLDLENASSIDEIVQITKEALKDSLEYEILDLVKVDGNNLIDLSPTLDGGGYFNTTDGPGVIAKVARTQQPVLIHDTQEVDYVPRANETYYRSELAVPVLSYGNTVMVINLESFEPNAFTLQDKYLIETFASHISAAFDRITILENMESLIQKRNDELANAENRYHTIVSTFHLGIFEFYYENEQIWLSDEFQNQLGFDGEYRGEFKELLDSALSFIHIDDREDLLKSINHTFIGYNPLEIEIRVVPDNSPEKWLKISGSVKFDKENKPEKVVGISIDITELKHLEKQLRSQNALLQELDEMKNQFITTATHELRTPVASILGYIEYVIENDEKTIPENVLSDLNVVHRNALRLVNLTNDLLDVQRLTTGRFEIQKTEFDFVSMLNEVIEELTPMLNAKKQVLRVNTPPKVLLHADKVRISQVLINLIHNANKFTPEGGILSLTVEPKETTVDCIVVDNGIGLNENDLNKLFEPFPSIRHGNNVRSTGLGLAISKGILELHGGKIWAESTGQGKGSRFHISIPYFDD